MPNAWGDKQRDGDLHSSRSQHPQGMNQALQTKHRDTNRVIFDGEGLEQMKSSTYFDTTIDKQGGLDAGVMARIKKPRAKVLQLKMYKSSYFFRSHKSIAKA
ncbi:hypothetical protein MS3_00000700 [Schistosoma haematobium]|uniref:Uncharacterized protein n=1 Tax=Schistosoma haematobium TaxID=6185 RepID=A0A922IJ12_SCHHA|nr:hypothetical protein MS3_00000700 [Schistosoma haematobium]KAH9580556.1 hypothetical protein MS3_00000700 [Schistosoma haematobium]